MGGSRPEARGRDPALSAVRDKCSIDNFAFEGCFGNDRKGVGNIEMSSLLTSIIRYQEQE